MKDNKNDNSAESFYDYDFNYELDMKLKPIDKNTVFDILNNEETSLIVLDTNILLGLVEVTNNTGLCLLNIFNEIKNIIWIPYQVYNEFETNRNSVYSDACRKYDLLIKRLSISINRTSKNLLDELRQYCKYNSELLEDLEEELNLKNQYINNAVEKYKMCIGDRFAKDNDDLKQLINDIEKFVEDLKKDNRTGNKLRIEEILEIVKEGDIRYKYYFPPGYKDSKKFGIKAFGDLFIWKEILNLPKKMNLNRILFVTNDLKEDWWKLKDGNIKLTEDQLVMRYELYSEFIEANPNTSIDFIQLNTFYKYASEYLKLENSSVLVELNKNDASYIDRIKDKVIDFIKNEINEKNSLSYYDFQDEGMDNVTIVSCEFSKLNNVFYKCYDTSACLTYALEFTVKLVGFSGSWEVDHSCNSLYKSYTTEHNITMSVKVQIDRIFEQMSYKYILDRLKTDNEFHSIEIVDAKITDYRKDIEESEISASSYEEFTCPICGRLYRDEFNDEGGICVECHDNMCG